MISWIWWVGLGVFLFIVLLGFRVIRPTQKCVVETFGKFGSVRSQGLNWIIPFVQQIRYVNVTERMTDIEPQEVITCDNLNCKVDLVIFYRIRRDDESVKRSLYEVNNVDFQIETLARTTARNVIGTLPFKEVNSERNVLNKKLQEILSRETTNWGVDVLKVELKDIMPPKIVQDSMNRVIQSENEKDAAVNLAQAAETTADGIKRASIKQSEGRRQSQILEAEGLAQSKIIIATAEAQRIKMVNEAADKYFVGNAQKLRQMDVTQASLENNSKIILSDKGINPQLLIGELPMVAKEKK